jgi:uncharacterized protein (DUF302 family)
MPGTHTGGYAWYPFRRSCLVYISTVNDICNPPLAHRALSTRIDVGLLLPCTVIVYEDGDGAEVNILNPLAMTELIPEPELQAVMGEARARLARVSEALNR